MPRKPTLFRSAFPRVGAPTPQQILDFHRLTFGDSRMEDGGGDGGDGEGGEGGAGAGGGGDEETFTDPDTGEKFFFPKDTPTSDMKPEQVAEYWRHKARKHEGRANARNDYDAIKAERDQLKQAGMSDAEKAVEDARREAREAAERETSGKFQARIVRTEVRAALALAKMPADKIDGQVEYLDHTKFLTSDGEVDTDKVKQYAAGFAPAGGQWPDTGGGDRGGATRESGVSAGAQRYAERTAKK